MEIRINGNDKKQLFEAIEGILRMKGVEHVLIADADDKFMVANSVSTLEKFIYTMLLGLFTGCKHKKEAVLKLLDVMKEMAEELPDEEREDN